MKADEINILFTSSGRRVSLVKKFKEAYALHGIKGKIVTADLKPTAPTAFMSDRHVLVPRVTEPDYLERLLAICREERIHLVVPLIDTELVLLADHKPLFDEINVKLLLSSKELNEMANDKQKTYEYFSANGIATPKVYGEDELEKGRYQFPLMIKPRNGSSSQGVTKILNERELRFFKDYIPGAIVQQFVTGDEYTVDVMVDFGGNIKTIVPRLRIETRAGEVSKGITRKNEAVIAAAEKVVRALPGPVGCVTLQCFEQQGGEITFIEINPRFGGGIPLAIEAGADFPLWTIRLGRGESFAEGQDYGWCDRLTMLRYDDAVFTKEIAYGY
ncbi:ATP-grasp domain-containing protein [Paenibacillus arenilitoris]|uniref:ATP-grasp domain-containing protein n=1 Tax=Paenibacillus arenilitoris TaxID=2772299 RepID=A0A927H8X9_9BACL|nr:ATP-grasp domain-containing protein [Paenibacillus arenilitoris]MBD2872042.1 ATP-grasp domain-containing protein [Paenibacillus arenilitoris]